MKMAPLAPLGFQVRAKKWPLMKRPFSLLQDDERPPD
jgi:hypothetical protein